MYKKNRVKAGVLAITMLFSMNLPTFGDEDIVNEYVGENGIRIVSYSQEWNSLSELQSVYDELMSNAHGNEVVLFDAVYIFPEKRDVAALYYDGYNYVNDQYVYLPERYIEIYNGDSLTEIEDIARTLAHEYGHHFMFYYLMVKEQLGKEEWSSGKYGQLRELQSYDQVTYLGNDLKPYDHKWDVAEILADDYVQLYGSELARASRDYLDVTERIEQEATNYYYFYGDYNLLPQENLTLPLAADVEGLAEYFYFLTGIPTHVTRDIDVPEPELIEINQVYNKYFEYVFEWDAIDGEGDYEYTLVMNDTDYNDYPLPIKTVRSDEALLAVAGSAVDLEKNRALLGNLLGDYELTLFAKDSNGAMYASDPVLFTITQADNSPIKFSDVALDFWAVNDIYKATGYGVVEGYPDGTFRPEDSITRAEIITFLVRSLMDYQVEVIPGAPDWFIEQGYATAAIYLGIINVTQYTPTYYNQPVSREEIADYMYRLLYYGEISKNVQHVSTFSDLAQSRYPHKVSIINYYGIIDGYPDGTFGPKRQATRAEAIKMISRFMTLMGYM